MLPISSDFETVFHLVHTFWPNQIDPLGQYNLQLIEHVHVRDGKAAPTKRHLHAVVGEKIAAFE